MNLTIDIGNSSAKAALFDGGRLVEVCSIKNYELRIKNYDKAIVVSTRGEVAEIENAVRAAAEFFVKFDHTTPVPIRNLYATPETLGYDRLAAAVGAHDMIATGALGRVEAALVVDFGTAITYDVVTAAGEFLGGNISPGVASRFRAMHEHTGALPMGALPEAAPEFPARETKTAIGSGVAWGIAAETERYILEAEEKFGTVGVIFTGGDADYFARRVKFPIFAVSELVFRGLNAILEHNANL